MKMRKKHCFATVPMIHRMQQLRNAGLSIAAVQAVIELDYGEAPCADSVRTYTSSWSPVATSFSGLGHGGIRGMTSGPNRGAVA